MWTRVADYGGMCPLCFEHVGWIFFFIYGIHGYSSSFNAQGRNARLCFFQSERGCGPKSCNDRFPPVFSCARGPAIRAPFPRDRPVSIPPEPSARPLTVRRENRTGTTDIKRQNVGTSEKVLVLRSIANGTDRKNRSFIWYIIYFWTGLVGL